MLELVVNPWSKDPQDFASLEAARDHLREHGVPPGGVTVWLAAGDYLLDAPFTLTAADSGTPEAPVVYRGFPGARLLGGRQLTHFLPVTDPAVRARLAPEVRDAVVVADLAAAGVTDCGSFSHRGFGYPVSPAHLELFFAGKPMTVAQWPKAGAFTEIAGVVAPRPSEWDETVGDLSGGFLYAGDRPRGWAEPRDLWVHGYWCYDWANSYEQVTRLDVEARIIETAPPYGRYAFKPGQRFYFLNILEELTDPGEYYVDRDAGLLYFLPPAPLEAGEALVSVLEEPLIRLDGASHVQVHGLTLEAGRGSGIAVTGGEGVTISYCTLRNLGNLGIVIDGGTGHTVRGCTIHGTGDGGIDVRGGNRETLTPAWHVVEECHLHHYARWSRTYQPGVHARGVGIRITHNLIHDCPHKGILYWGNEITVEANEIYRMCLETGDAGAIYTGRDYTFRGNVVRDNFVHHMGGRGIGTSAIYMDDCVSGHEISGNVVWEGDAIWLGGGRDFRIHDNVFIACKGAVCFDARGVSPHQVWQTMVNITMRDGINAMPWAASVPEIAAIFPHFAAGTGVPPEGNEAVRNLCVDCVPVRWGWPEDDRMPQWLTVRENVEMAAPGFVDPEWGDFRLRPDASARTTGIRPPALDTVGIAIHPPALVRSRLVYADGTLTLGLRNDSVLPAEGVMVLPLPDSTIEFAYCLEPGEMAEHVLPLPAPEKPLTLEAYDREGTARPARVHVG
jgi:hypothetical protein